MALPTELPENQTFLKAPIPDSCGKREKKPDLMHKKRNQSMKAQLSDISHLPSAKQAHCTLFMGHPRFPVFSLLMQETSPVGLLDCYQRPCLLESIWQIRKRCESWPPTAPAQETEMLPPLLLVKSFRRIRHSRWLSRCGLACCQPQSVPTSGGRAAPVPWCTAWC